MQRGRWVCGFLFHSKSVALLLKRHGPAVVVGHWNGIGGKIEDSESAVQAMAREFNEEAGLLVPPNDWRCFCELEVASYGTVWMMTARLNPRAMRPALEQRTDEPVMWTHVRKLGLYPVVPNLHWLIPLALDPDNVFAYVRDPK